MTRKLIIDADPGIGDALAVLCAVVDPTLEVVAVTAVAGTVSGLQATRNLQTIIELLDPKHHPRIGGSNDPAASVDVANGSAVLSPANLNGPGGLGDFLAPEIDLHNRRDSPRLIVDLVREAPNEVTVLTLGPLTNLARAFEIAPDLPGLLDSVIIVGGSVESGGDVTPVAEFNIWAADQAARLVLTSAAPIVMAPLDVTSQPILTPEQAASLHTSRSAGGRLAHSLLHFSLRAHRQYLGIEGIRLDPLCGLAAISRPELFKSKPLSADVETEGQLTRGMTVFDRRNPHPHQANASVLTSVDTANMIRHFDRLIRRV